MNYWLSHAKMADGFSRVAAFNVKRRGPDLWVGAAVINENTQTGLYPLFNGEDTITLYLPPEWSTQDGLRCVVGEVWKTHGTEDSDD